MRRAARSSRPARNSPPASILPTVSDPDPSHCGNLVGASAKGSPARRPPAYSDAVRTLIVILILATLSACGDIVIGPVDHSCPGNPSRGRLGSGCGGGGGH